MGNKPLSLVLTARQMAVVAVSTIALNCGSPGGEKNRQEAAVSKKSIEAVQNEHTDELMSVPGVVGTAIGNCDGKPCIKIMVNKKTPELLKKIPSTLEGYPVKIDETGEFRALDSR
jgi:hypothetical protein